MNKEEVLAVFQGFFPTKTVSVNYDDNCVQYIEQNYINGKPLLYGKIYYNRVRVDVQDMPSQYVTIDLAILEIGTSPLRTLVESLTQTIIPEYDLIELKQRKIAAEAPGAPQSAIDAYLSMLNDLSFQSGYTTQQILEMLPI